MLHVCKLAASIILHGLIAKVQGWGDRNNKIQLQKTTITIIINICTPLHFLKSLSCCTKALPSIRFLAEETRCSPEKGLLSFLWRSNLSKSVKVSKLSKKCPSVKIVKKWQTWNGEENMLHLCQGPTPAFKQGHLRVKSESNRTLSQIWVKQISFYFTLCKHIGYKEDL